MTSFTAHDWIEIIKALSALLIPLATAYVIIGARRAGRAEAASIENAEGIKAVITDVARLEKNTNSISERNQAIAEKLGITIGIAQERASNLAGAALPLPVSDEKTAAAVDKVVDAIEKLPSKDV